MRKRTVEIAPSILSANFSSLERDIKVVEKSKASWLHLDVMDGHFVPNITFGPKMVRDIRKITDLTLDTHLMISNPDIFIPEFANAGSDLITIHYEATIHVHRSLSLIKQLSKRVGLSIVPSTPVSVIFDMLPFVDLVLIMSVNPGFGGQDMIPEMLEKVALLKEERDKRDLDFLIEIDGGVNRNNCHRVVEAGVDVIVAGSAVFNSENPIEEISFLYNCGL